MTRILSSIAAAAAISILAMLGSTALAQTPAQPAYTLQNVSLPAADHLAIVDLIARMNQAIDSNDYAAYSQFYIPQGVIDSGFGPATVGRVAIIESLTQFAPFITNKRHVAANIVINGSGRAATATYYLTVFERKTGLTLAGTALITDQLRRGTTGWQVVRHTTRMDPATQQAMSAAMGGRPN